MSCGKKERFTIATCLNSKFPLHICSSALALLRRERPSIKDVEMKTWDFYFGFHRFFLQSPEATDLITSRNLKLRVITPFNFSPLSLVSKEVHREINSFLDPSLGHF